MIPTAHRSPQPKWHVDRFSWIRTGDRRVSLQFTMGSPFPLNIAPPMGGSGPPSKTWFLGPAPVHNPNCISIGSAVFAGLTCVTDRPTDHATRWVTIGCIYVRSTAMRPNNKRQWSLQFEITRRRRRLATTHIIKMCLLTSASIRVLSSSGAVSTESLAVLVNDVVTTAAHCGTPFGGAAHLGHTQRTSTPRRISRHMSR